MGPRRPATTAAISVTLAAALAACGQTSPATQAGRSTGTPAPGRAASPAQHLTRAAGATTTAFHTDLTTRTSDTAGVVALHATGDYAAGTDADLHPAGGGAAPRELRLVGGVLYERVGNIMRPGGGGKPWLRATAATRSARYQRMLAQVERGRPTPLLRMAATARDIHVRTGRTTAGVPATRYSGTFAPATAAARVAPAGRWAVRDLRAYRTLRFDAWLDARDRPVRLTVTGSGPGRTFTLAQTFGRYGTPVHVTAPPSRQVGDAGDPLLPRPRT